MLKKFNIADWYDLKGQVAIVTGGATGLGLAITRCLISAGAVVCVAARSEPEKVAEALEEFGDRVHYYRFDITDTEKAQGNFSVFMTFLLGIKFIVRPVMTTKEAMQGVSAKKRAIQSLVCGMMIGFICGFVGAGGGMMMLLILTSVLGYELKTAVGTSVFIMAFTAFTGAASHFAIGGMPDWTVWILCVVFTLIWARIAALFANKATPKTLNRVTGVILVVLGIAVMCFNLLA